MIESTNPQLRIGSDTKIKNVLIEQATISPSGVFKITADLLNTVDSIIYTANQGVSFSADSDVDDIVISSLTWLKNSLQCPKTLQDMLHSNGEETGIRAYYTKTIANSFAEGFDQQVEHKQVLSVFSKFFDSYAESFSHVSVRNHDLAVSSFENAAKEFHGAIKKFDASYGLLKRHSDFRNAVQADVEHLRSSVPNSHELWIVRCYDSASEFARKFPTASGQREVSTRVKEMSLEVALKRLAS